jgi:hypothetical protein
MSDSGTFADPRDEAQPLKTKLRRFREELRGAHHAATEQNDRAKDAFQLSVRQEIDRLLAAERYADPRRLERHGFKAYSQGDEDGILQEIFRRIGAGGRSFCETGVGYGLENNTVYLLHSGWSGAWIEADAERARWVRHDLAPAIAKGQLKLIEASATAENINDLMREADVPGELDLWSLDIDGNDYHVLKALTAVRPRVLVLEYNAKFAPPVSWVMPYEPEHRWSGNDKFGASLTALTGLAAEKGYALVGCSVTGANAFFVRNDLLDDRFQPPYTAENYYQPIRYYLIAGMAVGHPPTFMPSASL